MATFHCPRVKESTQVKYSNLLRSYILPNLGMQAIQTLTHEKLESVCNNLLVKGGREDLSARLRPALLGIEKNDFSFEALYDVKSGITLPAGIAAEKPSIDQIVVHLIEDMRY